MTIWLPVKGFPKYEINQYGEIRNRRTGHIKQPQTDSWGYQQVSLHDDTPKKNHRKTVHRLLATTFFDGDHEGFQVNHIDGNKQNNFLGNLEFVTGSENVQHAYDTGIRKPSGGRGPLTKIKIVETGDVYDNMHECAKAVNGDSGNISRCVNGHLETYKGYHYIRVNEGDE